MNQTLRPQPLLSEVLPGALTLGLILYVIVAKNPALLEQAQLADAGKWAIAAGAFLLGSWMMGTILDSIRNLFEHLWDRWSALDWGFFFRGDRDKVTQLDEHYFAYYTAKANYVFGLLVFAMFLVAWWLLPPMGVALAGGIFVAGVCTFDAISLRGELKQILPKNISAHDGVFTRLMPSQTFPGIGVVAIRDIPAGTNIFAGDNSTMRDIDPREFDSLDPELRRLYFDFCVFKGGKVKGPTNFNSLTVGWYLNHSTTPNVRCREDYDFFALRNIDKGEELTVDYSTYDDREVAWGIWTVG